MNRLTKFIYIIIIIILLFIILCLLLGFDNISSFFSANYNLISSLASIATFLGLIYTVYYNGKNHAKDLENARISANQLEFEKRLYEILCVYDSLISDLLFLRIEMLINDNDYISNIDLVSMTDLYTKYGYILNNIHDKIYFFYREMNGHHPELDKLIKDIEGVNTAVCSELNHYSVLTTDGLNINSRYKIDKIANTLDDKKLNAYYDEVSRLLNRKKEITSSIINIISSKKSLIYQEAAFCIEERAEIIRKK